MTTDPRTQWLVFTDLDGTLLDHDSYDHGPACPALERLRRAGIPVIPATSKTLAELDELAPTLGLSGPRVAENGSVSVLPGPRPLVEVTPPGYAGIRAFLAECREQRGWRFRGFGDMTLEEIGTHTAMGPDQAARAAQRLGSEPLLWLDERQAEAQFRAYAAQRGLRVVQGGRFLHLLGDTDKGRALHAVVRAWGGPVSSIALGDSPNDRDLLLAADICVIVRRKDGGHLALPQRPDAIITEGAGPAGWNQAIHRLLDGAGG
jgi:mannosyl-3-phosphoglycerate phosphatase